MALLLALMLTAAPSPCEAIWPTVWKAYSTQQLKTGRVPLYVRIPNAEERLARVWIAECRTFDKDALICAQGKGLETQLKVMRSKLAEDFPPAEVERMVQKIRTEWTVLECGEVFAALRHAGAAVMRETLDAGAQRVEVPRSDDCAGDELTSGKCQCAHGRCMDTCCPEGWACAHSGASQAKCVKPR